MNNSVWIVDDDELAAAVPRIALDGQFTVSVIPSGVEALSRLESFRPDVILLDIRMPDLDGCRPTNTI